MEKYWIAVLISVICILAALLIIERFRYRKQLKKLNGDLDLLLRQGTPLPIDQYEEGELSVLACQMEKITLRLTEAAETVRREKEALADSLADISHQLRTPLTAMNLAAAMLRKPGLAEEKRRELTEELRRQLRRIDWLVETLLKLSKLDAGTIKFSREEISVQELAKKAAEPLAVSMDIRNQNLVINCGDAKFRGDLSWTSEALGNILKNCMEHTPDGGTITITAEETPLFTRIETEDTGPGFDPEDLPHLFDRFYQGRNASPMNYGIGLSLARAILAEEDGVVQAANTEKGAKFTIKLYKQVI